MAVGLWTLVKKSDYISLLSSRIYAVSAYILCLAGAIVMVTGVLGCCATFKEKRQLLRVVRRETRASLTWRSPPSRVRIERCDENDVVFSEGFYL